MDAGAANSRRISRPAAELVGMRLRGWIFALIAAALVWALPPARAQLPGTVAKLTLLGAFDAPVAMAFRSSTLELYVAEKSGRVRRVRDSAVVLDVAAHVSTGGEQGLLGMAFSPDGAFLYVNYTDLGGDTRVFEYSLTNGQADVASARQILYVDQPYENHNGGNVAFGPDGYLYVGLGDGGSGGDPHNHAQRLDSLLGKVLRVDPRGGAPYAVPSDNPFVGVAGARPEIWAYGLRNPWRWSFDKLTGDLWIGDVGQSSWEEVDFQPAASAGGENYGWRNHEGNHPYGGDDLANHSPPVHEYPHLAGNCSITGGYVYRGTRIPVLHGAYLFADFCAGNVIALRTPAGVAIPLETGLSAPLISSFGEGPDGELYVLSLGGPVYRIDPIVP